MAIITAALYGLKTPQNNPRAALERLLAAQGGAAALVEPGAKPLVFLGQIWPAAAGLGLNPEPHIIEALAQILLAAGAAEVIVAAQAAPGFAWQQTLELAGYTAIEQEGISFCDLAQAARVKRPSKLNLAMSELELPQILLQSGCLINLAKFRAAEGLLFGAAVLNLQAAAELPVAADYQARALLDLHSILTPDWHLVDAAKGDQGYQPQAAGALLAATDAVALDIVLMSLAGYDLADSAYLGLAAQYGLGSAQAADIQLLGDDWPQLFAVEPKPQE